MFTTCNLPQNLLPFADNNNTYYHGNEIHLRITLYTHNDQRKSSGGDLVKVLIENTHKQAFSPGRVTDNKDGTYTAVVDALWEGQGTIQAYLQYSREEITALYRMRREVGSLGCDI